MSHRILISGGSNVNRDYYTRAGFHALCRHFTQVRCSRVFESESVGFDGSPFYNYVAVAETHMAVADVVAVLKAIELENGRSHSEKKFCSRTLDLDLLTYDTLVVSQPVELPREEILYNAFVLQPLAELVPDDLHPQVRLTYRQLWERFDKGAQRLWPITFTWSLREE